MRHLLMWVTVTVAIVLSSALTANAQAITFNFTGTGLVLTCCAQWWTDRTRADRLRLLHVRSHGG